MRLRSLTVLNDRGGQAEEVEMGRPFRVRVEYDVNQPVDSAHVICFVHTADGTNVFGSGDADCAPERLGKRDAGSYTGEFEVSAFLLGEGRYSIAVSLGVPFKTVFDRHESVVYFNVVDNSSVRRQWYEKRRPGILGFDLPWTYLNAEPVSEIKRAV
jgi:hypothetical protein